jgi:hypothetical protein
MVDAAHHQTLFASVKLERLAQIKLQRHEGFDTFASITSPILDEVRHTGVATFVAV